MCLEMDFTRATAPIRDRDSSIEQPPATE
jgi:hypothetical protein